MEWIKSSLSFSTGNCVEVAGLPDGTVGVRNSRDLDGPVLAFTPDEWAAFLDGASRGEFDHFGRWWSSAVRPSSAVRRSPDETGAQAGG